MILSAEQITKLAYDAGFRGDALRWAVAVALAESGGNTSAYNPETAAGGSPDSGSRGLWQIYGTAHPQYNSSIAFDPIVNARAAYEVYREAGARFTPWSTYNQGMATPYYQRLNIGNVPSQPSSSLGSASGGVSTTNPIRQTIARVQAVPVQVTTQVQNAQAATANALNSIASGQFITNAIDTLWKKIDTTSLAFYLGGIVLIVIGLIVLFQRQIGDVAILAGNTALAGEGIPPVLSRKPETETQVPKPSRPREKIYVPKEARRRGAPIYLKPTKEATSE